MNFYTTKNAVQYLARSCKTQNEIDALNKIIEDLNYRDRDRMNDNICFAKLFLYLYEGNLIRFKDSKATWQHIDTILKQPLPVFYENIQIAYNEIKDLNIFAKNNIEIDATKIIENNLDESDQFKKMSADDLSRISNDVIELNKLQTTLDEMITNAIKTTKS